MMHFAKASPEGGEGSALRAAGALHASAHVHAVRYGARGSKAYRSAYSQHVGRFLGCMREFQRVGKGFDPAEMRDRSGRWAASVETGGYTTGGTTGLTREQVVQKVGRFLKGLPDRVVGHEAGSRVASYGGYAAGKAAKMVAGMATPPDVADMLEHHVAHATAVVIGKLRNDPKVRKVLITALAKAPGMFRKSLEPATTAALKGHVARIVADTCLPPRVACDDRALAAVAHNAYRALHDDLSARAASLSRA